MAEEQKLIGIKTDIPDLVKNAIIAYISKCVSTTEFLSKKGGPLWEQAINPPKDMRDKVMATGTIALQVIEMINKDPETLEELVMATLARLAEKGQKLSNEEMEYVKKEMSKEDEYRSMYQ